MNLQNSSTLSGHNAHINHQYFYLKTNQPPAPSQQPLAISTFLSLEQINIRATSHQANEHAYNFSDHVIALFYTCKTH
jgi:hypothetical protein